MKSYVCSFVAACDTCQTNRHKNILSPGLLQPLPIPRQIWTKISMDFIEGLPMSHGKQVIFVVVVVDRLSKYVHFIPLKHPYSALDVAQLFLDNVFKLYGLPTTIVSDRDRIFTSQFWQSLFSLLNVNLLMRTIYHP